MTAHEEFMERAMALAQQSIDDGNRPAGCVIVKDGKIIGEGRNLVNTEIDPTAHGEIVAIRRTASSLASVNLSGCTLYTSMEPCPMCCWAMIERAARNAHEQQDGTRVLLSAHRSSHHIRSERVNPTNILPAPIGTGDRHRARARF